MTTIYRPKEGHVFNPLTRGDLRNLPCPCESGKKTKKCCGRMRVMPKDLADEFKALEERKGK